MKYSFIVPVYNRPDEVDELLESLEGQTLKDFEVVVVEDGSDKPCKDVCDRHADVLDIHYYIKPNSGPGQSRNYGAERAGGEYLIVLDSDVVLPEGYLAAVDKELQDAPADAFGGPDRAHPSFTDTQKAISYSMTSFYTTGGIRGGNKKLDKFYPRSFNMGIRRETYMSLGGFSRMRFGEIYRNCRGGRERHADVNIYHRRGYYKQHGFDGKHTDYNSHRRGGAARAGNEGAHIDFCQLIVVNNGDNQKRRRNGTAQNKHEHIAVLVKKLLQIGSPNKNFYPIVYPQKSTFATSIKIQKHFYEQTENFITFFGFFLLDVDFILNL